MLLLLMLSAAVIVCSQEQQQVCETKEPAEQQTAPLCSSSGDSNIIRPSNAFAITIGVPFVDCMVDYFADNGIMEMFEGLFDSSSHMEISIGEMQVEELSVRGYHWYIERPSTNLHTMAPENEIAYHEFLGALKEGGLDAILERIAAHFEWENLVVYQASVYGFWGEMQSNETTSSLLTSTNRDVDVVEMVIPILLPEKGVQLRIVQSSDDEVVVRHERGAAILVREAAYTQSVEDKEEDMIVAISLVVGEISTNGATTESILHDLNQTKFPDKDYLSNACHWNRSNASVAVPESIKRAGDFVYVENIQPAQIEPIRWAGNPSEIVTDYAFQVGLPPELMPTLLQYCDEMGITQAFEDLVIHDKPLHPGKDVGLKLKDLNWYVQRPAKHWKSNMHWISPLDKESQDDYLKVLSKGGFDKILQAIGERFNLEGLVAYHITFIGVSHCDEGYDHYDFTETGGRGFNVIIPLILADNYTTPELDISNDQIVGSYKYQYGAASMLGDEAYHATAAVDYRASKQMRVAATVYVADIQQSNIDTIMEDYTQKYPLKGDYEFLLSLAGTHWKRDDASVRLPVYERTD